MVRDLQLAGALGASAHLLFSSPPSLAVDLAERAGIALVGFASGKKFNVYAHSERVGFGSR